MSMRTWVAVDNKGEAVFPVYPERDMQGNWCGYEDLYTVNFEKNLGPVNMRIDLPEGTIKKLIGHPLALTDKPVKLE